MIVCQDLAEQMDYEGGMPEFLLHVGGSHSFKGLPFYEESKKFIQAYHDLRQKMDDVKFPWL